jgi:hypothetical protein
VRKIVSILLLLCLFIQAIPVMQFLCKDGSLYSYIDEEKPTQKSTDGKQVQKDSTDLFHTSALKLTAKNLQQHFYSTSSKLVIAPYLDTVTPPPNFS